ncbi:aminoacyl-tRNA deacylase [Bowmanella yangjiangensis]|uniref:YbaK/EbsC family protein n=1 Tax=Bowmanella yangjiangensis TaxID=2811230 RepID=A0ABS3CMI3_9ALTE|nr:YbaK/EbsC family protein [Bowmanella yangjiangensis]MBN7818317.1 YbaK/EbsC family protein [Bowmanella yangjiangensis]
MSLSQRVMSYLNDLDVHYEVITHHPSHSSLGSAIAAQVPSAKIAKAVMLEDGQGHRLMAVLPADSKLSISALNDALDGQYHLMKEQQVYQCFDDCEHGAVPPLPQAFNLDCIVDDSLEGLSDLYIEGGDHRSLVHLSQHEFARLMAQTRSGHFSHQLYH